MGGRGDRARLATLLRFSAVSLAGTGIDFLVLWLLHAQAGISVLPASLASTECSIVTSFILSEVWAFQDRAATGSLPGRFVAFNGLYLSMFVTVLVVVGVCTALFGPRYYLLYKAATLPVNFIWNYLWSTRLLWRQKVAPTGDA